MGSGKRAALARARRRRVELDRDRADRDRRVEAAAARIFVLLEQRAVAQHVVHDIDTALGGALRDLMQEGLPVPAAAQYCELPPAEVRRLTRLLAAPAPPASPREDARLDAATDPQPAGNGDPPQHASATPLAEPRQE